MRRFHRRLAFLGCVSLAAAILWAAPPVIASTSGSQSTGNQAAAPADTPVSYSTTVVLLGSAKVIGALYQPTTPDARQSTALFLTHENADEIGALDCLQLAQRGYTVLCVKSQYSEQAEANWDALAKDVAASVTYLRSLPTGAARCSRGTQRRRSDRLLLPERRGARRIRLPASSPTGPL